MLFCLFFSTVLVPLTRPLWIKSEKMCHKNWEFGKTNTSPLIKHRLLTLKSLSLSPTLFKVLLQNPKPLHPTSRGFSIQHNLNRNVRRPPPPPFVQEASMRLSGQTQNARRRKRKMRNCLTHTMTCQRGNTIWQPDKWPIMHLLFLFFMIFHFFSFCCLHNETPCIGWEIQNKQTEQVVINGEVQVEKIATHIARLHICIFFHVPLLQVHGPTWSPPPPPPHLQPSPAQVPD